MKSGRGGRGGTGGGETSRGKGRLKRKKRQKRKTRKKSKKKGKTRTRPCKIAKNMTAFPENDNESSPPGGKPYVPPYETRKENYLPFLFRRGVAYLDQSFLY